MVNREPQLLTGLANVINANFDPVGLPDLLAEIKWNLDWMLTMQANDGSVYHKLTSLGFPGDVMPAQDNLKLYVIGKSAEAAFDFAGVMAVAARVYKPFDSNYANKCLEAAKKPGRTHHACVP